MYILVTRYASIVGDEPYRPNADSAHWQVVRLFAGVDNVTLVQILFREAVCGRTKKGLNVAICYYRPESNVYIVAIDSINSFVE